MKNTKLLTYTGFGSLGLLSLVSCKTGDTADKIEDKPNIILIMTDDQGFGDIAFHGNPDIHTPVMDQLARQSTRFTNFYVSPVSAPTRSSLMTGRYSLRTGVHDTYNGGAIMATEEITIAEVLKDAGYNTGIFGKWHLGDNYPYRPMDQGFNESLVHLGGGIGQVGNVYNYFRFDSSYYDPTLWKNGKPVKTNGYCSDVYTEAAIDFISDNKDDPFFLYLSYNAPHTPLQVPYQYFKKYKDLEIHPKNYPENDGTFPDMNNNDIKSAKGVYAMVENIDDNLGQLFDKVQQAGLDSNTLIIFLTDNGPQQRRFTGGLRGRKGSVYEGGIRVPCFMSLPSFFPEDKEISSPVAHLDIFPTILDLCGLKVPENVNIDGGSLISLLKGDTEFFDDRTLFFNWARGYPEPYKNVAARTSEYKLVGQTSWEAKSSDLQLFNIKDDPYENNDLSDNMIEKTSELKEEFDNWYLEVIGSTNLKNNHPIFIGTEFENPVFLNRNDAKGSEGIWAQEDIFGYWDINIVKEGYYDIIFRFIKEIKTPGTLKIKAGTILRSKQIKQYPFNELKMENVWLYKGKCMFVPSYKTAGKSIFPLYIKISKGTASRALY